MKQKDIALIIGVSGSALSRELSRNTGKRGYRAEQANTKALDRRKNAAKAIKMTLEVCAMIEEKIQLDLTLNRFLVGCVQKRTLKSVMNGYINMSGQISAKVVSFISIYATATKYEKNSTDHKISVARLGTESVLMNDLRLSDKECGSGIGK